MIGPQPPEYEPYIEARYQRAERRRTVRHNIGAIAFVLAVLGGGAKLTFGKVIPALHHMEHNLEHTLQCAVADPTIERIAAGGSTPSTSPNIVEHTLNPTAETPAPSPTSVELPTPTPSPSC